MKKCRLFLFLALSVVMGMGSATWAADIGMIAPRSVFTGGEDPVNDELDKEFVIETMELEEPGLAWLVRHLEDDLGHTVNIFNAGNDDPVVVSEMNDLIYITEAISSGQVGSDYVDSDKPILNTEVFLLDDWGFTGGANLDFTGRAHATELQIVNPDHPITQGLPESFVATINDETTGGPAIGVFGTWAQGGISRGDTLASLPSSQVEDSGDVTPRSNAPILLAVEAGTQLDIGGSNAARWAFLGISDETPVVDIGGNEELRTYTMLNETGIQLLDQTIAWLLQEDTQVSQWMIQ